MFWFIPPFDVDMVVVANSATQKFRNSEALIIIKTSLLVGFRDAELELRAIEMDLICRVSYAYKNANEVYRSVNRQCMIAIYSSL